MDIEFHYYVTYIIAQKAGFDKNDAPVIAYSSQYVDDNNIIFCINKGKDEEYSNYISQTMNIIKPKKRLMRIYPLFHFIPGNPVADVAKRRDGRMHVLNTTPDSKITNHLVDEALSIKPQNPYRIGIATHSFMDTWAHQNFIGYFDSFNSMAGFREKLTPNIGHTDAMYDPDIPGLIWKDRRLMRQNRVISNKKRFLDAAKKVFEKYLRHCGGKVTKKTMDHEWTELRNILNKAIGKEFTDDDKKNKKGRIIRYKKAVSGIADYKPETWFKESIETNIRGLPDIKKEGLWNLLRLFPDQHFWKKGYKEKHWFKFQENIKEHQHFAESLCKDIFEQIEIEDY